MRMNLIKNKIISICLSILTLPMIALIGCSEKASDYTEKEHIARVTALAKKRYIDNGDYDSLEVYPLYDSNDRLGYFLIELEPAGFEYVKLNSKSSIDGSWSLYTRGNCDWRPWARTVIDKENVAIYDFGHGKNWVLQYQRWSELDESGLPIFYKSSHFKIGNIENERRYLFEIDQMGREGLIPAVKRGDTYLNLVSLEEFVYESHPKDIAYPFLECRFNPVSAYDL